MRIFVSDAAIPLHYNVGGNLFSKNEFIHHKRVFEQNVLILVTDGILYINQNGVEYEVSKNHFVLLPAEEVHFGSRPSNGRLSYFWVHFTFRAPVTVYEQNRLQILNKETLIQKTNGDFYYIPQYGEVSPAQRAVLLFHQLLDLSRQEQLYSQKVLDYALSLLIMEISQEYMDLLFNLKNNIEPGIACIVEWIKSNCQKNITTRAIAEEFHYNQDYLAYLFKKSIGMTITQYINRMRINIAKTLMIHYEVTIKEVAYTSGFSDEKYFMKIFKKLEGVTPSQYKSAFKNKNLHHS